MKTTGKTWKELEMTAKDRKAKILANILACWFLFKVLYVESEL